MLRQRELKGCVMRSRFLILWVVAFAAAAALIFAPTAHVAQASTSGVVISAVYGGGGNSGAPYNADFVELFNAGTSAVDISGWSVQYGSSSSTGAWTGNQAIPASTSLAAGKYYLVQMSGTGVNGSPYTADLVASPVIAMSGSAGKVALFNTTTTFNGTSPVGNSNLIDFVGFGSANASETSPTAATSNSTAAFRKNNGCQDTDNNSLDFDITSTFAPRNSATTAAPCVTAPDMTVAVGESQDPIAPGSSVIYTVTASNDGTAAAANVDLSVTLSGTAGAPTAYVITNLTESGTFCSTSANSLPGPR